MSRGALAFRWIGPLLGIATAAVVALSAQDGARPLGRGGRGQFPPRDLQQEAAGTGMIRGRVVSLDTGSPLRRARVVLTASELRVTRVAPTDDEGRYEFRDLPAGRFTLTASQTGYLTLNYGQRRPLEPGTPVELDDGRRIQGVDFVLPRGSVITGTIADEFGEPLPDVVVQAMRYEYVGGRRTLRPTGRSAQTNDIGEYRIFGLPPADYYVTATMPRLGRVVINAVAQGRLPEIVGGAGRGLIAQRLEALAGSGAGTGTGYAPTYYPGTPDLGQAQPVMVGIAETVSAVSFGMSAVKLASISGTVIDSQGAPLVRARVTLQPLEGGPAGTGGGGVARGGGAFVLDNVPPGDYLLQVRGGGRGRGRTPQFARVPLSVNGSDIDRLIIATSPGATVSGRVRFGRDGAAPDTRSLFSVAAISTDPDPLGVQPGRVAEDGTFELRGLGGPYLFRVNNIPSGWTLESVRLGGADITDTPYAFSGEAEVGDLEIVLTDRITRVDGTVTDDRGEPVGGYTAVVFAQDRTLWGPQSRHVRTARPDQEGRFEILGLPPGRYLAVAVDYLEQGSEADPDQLEQLAPDGVSFALEGGETYRLELKN